MGSASLLHQGLLNSSRARLLMALNTAGADGLEASDLNPRALLLGLKTLGWADQSADRRFVITNAGRDALASANQGKAK